MQQHKHHPLHPLSPLSEFQAAQGLAASRARRRPTPEQGAALECLGHAVEYLVDESLRSGDTIDPGVTEAVHLLSAASRAVYLSCAELPRTKEARAGRTTHVLWKWLPSSPPLLPIFRSREIQER